MGVTDGRPGWVLVAALLAVALLCWPVGPARVRLRMVLPGDPVAGRWRAGLAARSGRAVRRVQVELAGAVGAALVGGLAAGPGGAVAAASVAVLGGHRWRAGRERRRRAGEVAALVDALAVMVGELRAGAHPAAAAAAAGSGAGPGARAVHRVLSSVAAGARLGGDVPRLLRRHVAEEPGIGGELERVAAAWSLSERHGAALAELLHAVRVDVEARVRLAGQTDAQLAGPRASASVLAGLPLLGVLLGQGIGARPWHVLAATPVGQVLLVVGTGLACAGLAWSGRITRGAVGG